MTAPRWGRCPTRSPEPSRRSSPTAPTTRARCPQPLQSAIQTRPSSCRHDPPPCRATPPKPIRRNATAIYKVSPAMAAPVGRNPPATTNDRGSRLRSAGSSRSSATACVPRPMPARMPRSPSPSTFSNRMLEFGRPTSVRIVRRKTVYQSFMTSSQLRAARSGTTTVGEALAAAGGGGTESGGLARDGPRTEAEARVTFWWRQRKVGRSFRPRSRRAGTRHGGAKPRLHA